MASRCFFSLHCLSILKLTVLTTANALSGYWPIADSPESIKASDLCLTASETSATSALVGIGYSIIESISIIMATAKPFSSFNRRTRSITIRCHSRVPWHMLIRATFIPPTASASSCSNPHVAGPMVHTSLVRRVLRNPFSFSSASVTASTSIAPSSCVAADTAPAPPEPLSDTKTREDRKSRSEFEALTINGPTGAFTGTRNPRAGANDREGLETANPGRYAEPEETKKLRARDILPGNLNNDGS
nr:2-isopropylmalate synthase A [Ipomoea trifida]